MAYDYIAQRDGGPDTTERLLRIGAAEIENLTAQVAAEVRAREAIQEALLCGAESRDRQVSRLQTIAADARDALALARAMLVKIADGRAAGAEIPVDREVIDLIETVLGAPRRPLEKV